MSSSRVRSALDDPYREATCRGCGGRIIEPSNGQRGKHRRGEGQWVHVTLPPFLCVPGPDRRKVRDG